MENEGFQNKGNKEDEDDLEKKITTKMYDPDRDDELNGNLGMAEYDNNIDNDKKYHIPRSKVQPIKKTKKNKTSFLTSKKSSLKETHTKEIN